MARRAKKLQEIKDIFEEREIDISLIDDVAVIKELRDKLGIISDKRHESYIKHNLTDIILITFFAVLANANEWIEIEEFAKNKKDWLRGFLELPNGTPSDDTIRIVISNLDSHYFYNLVIEFLTNKINDIVKTLQTKEQSSGKEILAIDGKTSCGSGRKETDRPGAKALHTLNVYSSEYGYCLGQVFVNEKSNEIPAMLDLLKMIDIKGAILTWDALNTQKETVAEVIRKKGDYVGALKGNQHQFYQDVKDSFTEDVLKELKEKQTNYQKTTDKEHSGSVTREYYLSQDIKWLYNKEKWAGLKALGMEKKTYQKNNGQNIREERYFIVSFTEIHDFAKAVREHWGVENGLHWHLDFTFKDDKNTTMAKTGAKNLQIMKKLALALLKLVQTLYNCSLKLIRYKLSLSFEKEIAHIFKMLNTEDLKKFLQT